MVDDAKSGTHIAEAKIGADLFFGAHCQFECNSPKIPPTMGLSSRKRKVITCFAAPFVSLSAQIVNELEFYEIMPLLTGTNV